MGILIAVQIGLLAYTYVEQQWVLALPGVAITVITVYFAASFRSLRRNIHRLLEAKHNDDLKLMVSTGSFRQWPVLVGILFTLLWFWIVLLIYFQKDFWCAWVLLGVLVSVLVIRWYSKADEVSQSPDA